MTCNASRIVAGIVCTAVLLVLAGVGYAQSQKQIKTDEPASNKGEIIACRFSALDVFVEIKIEDRNSQPSGLGLNNFTVYEDGIEQEINTLTQIGKQPEEIFILSYLPRNEEFNGLLRKVQVVIRMNDGRSVQSSMQIKLDANPESNFKTRIYSQGIYSAEILPTKK